MRETRSKRLLFAGLGLAAAVALLVVLASESDQSAGRVATRPEVPAGSRTALQVGQASGSHVPPRARAPLAHATPDEQRCEDSCGSECELRDGVPRCAVECSSEPGAEACPQGTVCALTRPDRSGVRRQRCLREECAAESDCKDGYACRTIATEQGTIRRCELSGSTDIGDRCLPDVDGQHLCKADAVCIWGQCVPATCQQDDACPRGTRCMPLRDADQRVCVPWCESDDDCAKTERCIDSGLSRACVARSLAEAACSADSCGDGEFCHIDVALAWAYRARCATECAPKDASACGPNEFCADSLGLSSLMHPFRCFHNCLVDDQCPDGYTCHPLSPDRGQCLFDESGLFADSAADL